MEWVGGLILLLLACAGGGAVTRSGKYPAEALTVKVRVDGDYSVVDVRDDKELFTGSLAACDEWIRKHT